MKIPIHKATDICFLGDTPVVITNHHYNAEKNKHKYRCNPLATYYEEPVGFSIYGFKICNYEKLKPTGLKLSDVANNETQEISLEPLQLNFPEHFL